LLVFVFWTHVDTNFVSVHIIKTWIVYDQNTQKIDCWGFCYKYGALLGMVNFLEDIFLLENQMPHQVDMQSGWICVHHFVACLEIFEPDHTWTWAWDPWSNNRLHCSSHLYSPGGDSVLTQFSWLDFHVLGSHGMADMTGLMSQAFKWNW
jgi:hypothetical protein